MVYYELKITIPVASRPGIIAVLAERGSVGFIENEKELIAYFPATFAMNGLLLEMEALKAVLEQVGLQNGIKFSCSLLPDQDWNESWKKGFKPLNVGVRFTILPPWEEQSAGRINLIVDPGMAFGTGHHETTRSCLVLMEKYDGTVPKNRFLDLGTGTGLLAIAASKLGYREIVAVDTDPLATDAARMNMKLNSVVNIEVREGSIDAVSETYDCIVANIISGVLIMLAPQIGARLNPQGIAVLSGILADQADEVVIEMQRLGLSLTELFPDGKWVSLVMAH